MKKTTLDQPGAVVPTFAEVITTYLGRTGCACGCGGDGLVRNSIV